MLAMHARRFKKYGGFFRTSVMGNPLVVVSDQTEIKRLLQAWPVSLVVALPVTR